jgi:ATP-dependent protease ClpP protease subunit
VIITVQKNKAGDVTVFVGELVDFTGTPAKKVIEEIGPAQNVRLVVNCGGGNTPDAIALYDALVDRENVTADIVGRCCSAAVPVTLSAKRIRMTSTARMMIHRPMAFVGADYKFLRQRADDLEKTTLRMFGILAKRAGDYAAKLWMDHDADTWLTAEQCREHGLVDEIYEPSLIAPPGFSSLVLPAPQQFPEEELFYEMLRAFGKLPVADVAKFKREVNFFAAYNVFSPGAPSVPTVGAPTSSSGHESHVASLAAPGVYGAIEPAPVLSGAAP